MYPAIQAMMGVWLVKGDHIRLRTHKIFENDADRERRNQMELPWSWYISEEMTGRMSWTTSCAVLGQDIGTAGELVARTTMRAALFADSHDCTFAQAEAYGVAHSWPVIDKKIGARRGTKTKAPTADTDMQVDA